MRFPLLPALVACLAAACSGGGSHPADGAAGGSGDPCSAALSQASAFCAPTFDEQVANNPCDAADATQATCTGYKTWTLIIVGAQTCVYNAAGTMLVGARDCGDTSGGVPGCVGGCTNYGIAPASYAACTSATGTRACPP
jgi:hypothetical protein